MTPPDRTNVWSYARRRSRRRATRVAILAPLAFLESVPKGLFHPRRHGLDGLATSIMMIADVGGETIADVRAARNGDPIVLCGRVHPDKTKTFNEKWAATMVHDRSVFTFGYELTIDVVWAGRIGREGSVTEAADRMGADKVVRSIWQVVRRAKAGKQIVLLCNSEGTAIADERDIPDPALVSWLREVLASNYRPDPPPES